MRSSAGSPLSAIPVISRVLRIVLLGAATLSTAAIAQQTPPNFGPNVIVFNPSMPVSQIQTTVDAIANLGVSSQNAGAVLHQGDGLHAVALVRLSTG